MGPDLFESMYLGQAPWDIPAPQPALVALEEAGEINGSVLDQPRRTEGLAGDNQKDWMECDTKWESGNYFGLDFSQ
jgi:hypothetical protein